jgi:hypothetical protein
VYHQAGTCQTKMVNAGDTLIEVPYEPVRAQATGQVVWTTSFFIRAEDPLLHPMTTSPCPSPGPERSDQAMAAEPYARRGVVP